MRIQRIYFALVAVVLMAASVHYKQGKTPTCIDNGLTGTCAGALAGLGNGDVLITLDVSNAPVESTCANPNGHLSPGQNPADVSLAGSILIDGSGIKNGNLAFTVTTMAPVTTWQSAGCPNSQWTPAITDIDFAGAYNGALTIKQEIPDGSGNFVTVLGPTPVRFP